MPSVEKPTIKPASTGIINMLDNTYTILTDKLVPETVNCLYSFSSGVALITSAAGIIVKYIAYFNLTLSVAVIGPAAIITGIIFAYYQHHFYKQAMMELAELENEVKITREQNKKFAFKYGIYFRDDESKLQDELSLELGRLNLQKPFFHDERGIGRQIFDIMIRYITDAGLSFGVTLFILTAFTSIPLAGLPLILAIAGSLLMATLTWCFIHRKNYHHQAQMDFNTKELVRQKAMLSIFEKKQPTSRFPDEKQEGAATIKDCLSEQAFRQGIYKKLLDDIYTEINRYFCIKGLIKIGGETKYSLITGRISSTFGPDFSQKVTQAAGYNNRNLQTALNISKLIEKNEKDPDKYYGTLLEIYSRGNLAHGKSIFSWLGCGNSQLAARLNQVFKAAANHPHDPIDFSQGVVEAQATEIKFAEIGPSP